MFAAEPVKSKFFFLVPVVQEIKPLRSVSMNIYGMSRYNIRI